MKVVSNSSPLIVLTKINRIGLLKHLFTDIQKELLNLREKGYWITDYYIEEITKRFKDH